MLWQEIDFLYVEFSLLVILQQFLLKKNYEIRGMSEAVCPSGNCGPKLKYMSCDGVIFSGRGALPTA